MNVLRETPGTEPAARPALRRWSVAELLAAALAQRAAARSPAE
jgi:hypothetical protein